MRDTWLRIRFWLLDKIGKRTMEKWYEGYGNYTEIPGWEIRGRFYPCIPKTKGEN